MKNSERIVALAALAVASCDAFGQAFRPNLVGTPGTFGTPYANLGLQDRASWELYRKRVGPDTVVGSVGLGDNGLPNPTLVRLTNQELGTAGGVGPFLATGQIMLGKTPAVTPASDALYLKDMTLANGATTPPSGGGYDANLHGLFDLRVGFVASGSAYVSARGGDLTDNDLFGGNRGTQGVYLHLAAGNVGATTAGQPGSAWFVGINGGAILFGPSSGAENALPLVPATNVLVSSKAAPANAGTAYGGPLEVSAKLIPDPAVKSNVLLQAKLGNNVITASFNPSDPAFGPGGFAWQTATPIVYSGKGAFDDNNPSVARLGILAPGDANADGVTDFNDLVPLAQNYNSSNDPTWSTGDFTGDGVVDFNDLVVLAQHYNSPAAAPPAGASAPFAQDLAAAFASVPEPTAPLALMAVAALAGRSRRRRR